MSKAKAKTKKKKSYHARNKVKKKRQRIIQGTIQKNKRGFGFISVENGDDIFVPRRMMNGAMNGDVVEAEQINNSRYEAKSDEARITKIVDRKYKEIVGRFVKKDRHAFVEPIDIHNSDSVYIQKNDIGQAKNGDIVVAKLTKYPDRRFSAEGRIVEVIAKQNAADADILGLIRESNLSQDFPDKVEREANNIPDTISSKQIENRTDYRSLKTVTIDGASSKDFDDAVSVERTKDDGWKLWVHIADVSEYVKKGTALDKEAQKRGNSIYLLDRVIPMLPEALSNGICSLNPNEERLTLTCEITLDKDGSIQTHEIKETVIKSDYRLVYDDVSDLLENDDKDLRERYKDIDDMLHNMQDLAILLNKKRSAVGSIDFELPEAEIIIGEDGKAEHIRPAERRTANRMIEEFMLLANKVVAEHFYNERIPFVYRVHEKPDIAKLDELKVLLAGFKINLSSKDDVQPKELADVLHKIKGTPAENLINRVMIRTMQKAEYRTKCEGHYGLAFRYYCHFTSPIRRYPDLFIHRVIKEYIRNGGTVNSKDKLLAYADKVSVHSSETEKLAMELEREVDKRCKVQYMSNHIDEEFDGIVSGVTQTGIFIELDNTIEGFVRYDSMDDYYVLDEKHYCAVGKDSGKTYAMGDKVKIRVAEANTIDYRIDFDIVFKK